MKKNIYLIILTIVTVICIIFGSIYHILGISSKLRESFPFSLKTKFLTEIETEQTTQALDAFSSIKADFNVVDLTICPGSSYQLTYNGSDKLYPVFSVENEVLNIEQPESSFNILELNSNKCELTITLPKDVSLSALELVSDVGDIDINDITADRLDIITDVGDISIDHFVADKIVMETAVGDIDLEDCTYGNLKITSDVGDVSIEGQNDLDSYSMDLSTDIGKIEIYEKKYSHTYVREKDGAADRLIYIHNDTGDISIND